MSYTQFDSANPVVGQTRFNAIESMRNNLLALRDMSLFKMAVGFNFSKAGGTAEQPAQHFFKKGAEWIRNDLTWGATGGAEGNVTQMVRYKSLNSGASYDLIETITFTYDANGNLETATSS